DRAVPAQPLPRESRLPVQRVARFYPQLPHPDPGPAGRHAGAPAADLGRRRLASTERRNHGVPVERADGPQGADDQPGAQLPQGACADARRCPIAETSCNNSPQGKIPMPFYEKGNVRIHYEETGSGFPLMVIPGGGLNSTVAGLATHPFNPLDEFKNEYRVI